MILLSGTCIKNRVKSYIISESDRNGKTQPLEYVTADNYEVNLLNEDLPYVTDYRSQKSLSAEDEYFKKFKNEQLTKAFNLLNPRQQKYISYRYGLGEYDTPHSRNNAAEYFGLTYKKATELEKGKSGGYEKNFFNKLIYKHKILYNCTIINKKYFEKGTINVK